VSHRIAILIPYFGEWPAWINFFVESCRANRAIDWIMFSDAAPPDNRAPNVRNVGLSFDEYKAHLSDAFGHDLSGIRPYKLCDFKPALPFVHRKLIAGYDFVGFGDLDVIYGDLRSFYDDATLDGYDFLSSHSDRVSGHLFLMRNVESLLTMFQRVPGWKEALRREEYICFDERRLFNFLRPKRAGLLRRKAAQQPRCLFREAYTTPGAIDRMRWYWEKGVLTNEYYPHQPFMYLHFMSWQSSRWHESQEHIRPGSAAPWANLPNVVQMDWRAARKQGFMISPQGIQPIERPLYE
jgi:hypothetical protein